MIGAHLSMHSFRGHPTATRFTTDTDTTRRFGISQKARWIAGNSV